MIVLLALVLISSEADLMDLGTDVPEYRYGFIAAGNFTKVASVIPIENKQPDEIVKALNKVIEHLGKLNKYIVMGRALLIQTNTLNLLTNTA